MIWRRVAEHAANLWGAQPYRDMDAAPASHWQRSDAIIVDRDGLPHFDGVRPELLKEYRKRVLLLLNSVDDSADDEAVRTTNIDKKKGKLRVKLLNGLHGKAWRRTEHLAASVDMLRGDGGEDLIFDALASLDKAAIVQKTEAFGKFFKRSFRRRDVSVNDYIAEKERLWEDLTDKDASTTLSAVFMA